MELQKQEDLYLETWTNGGVDMVIYLDNDKDIIENLKDYLDKFNIDEEIDIYRQDNNYRDNFTIRESVKDFENWVEYIEDVIKELNNIK